MLEIDIQLQEGAAPSTQIQDQLTRMIREGELVDGARLPSIRSLADSLRVAPGTVARVYRNLEGAGLIESKPRHGSRVIGISNADTMVAGRGKDFVAAARSAGLSLERAQEIVAQLWRS